MGTLSWNRKTGMSGDRAIIDIGSNTVRLVVFGGPHRAPFVLHNEKVSPKLGKGVAESGLLTEKGMGSALAALARFAALVKLRGIRSCEAVATAAVRDAANGGEFMEAVAALGVKARILNGEEEAIASAMGVIGAFPEAKGIVADLGGGSLELVHIGNNQCERGASIPFGSLHLPALRAAGPAKFAARLHSALAVTDWHCAPDEALYLVGGSHRALARFAMNRLEWPLDDPHGFFLSPEDALAACRSILRGKLPPVVPGLSSMRLAALPDTAALLSVLLREIRPARLVFSSWGLREGLLYKTLNAGTQRQDPLLAGVSAFTEMLGFPPAHATMVAGWTTPVNSALAADREGLRLAATMLAIAQQGLEPNLRSDHGLDWALRKRWIGIDGTGRAILAACIAANAGRSQLASGVERLAQPAELREAMIWGLAIRLCRRLSGLAPQVLSDSALSIEGPQLVLTIREPHHSLFGEEAQKDLRNLAEAMGLQPSCRFIRKAERLR